MIHAVVATVALAAVSLPIGGTAHRKTEEGNSRYEEKAYEDALRAYTEAQVAAPESPVLHYDVGNVLYRKENWAGAADAYSRALLSAPPSLAPLASYNLGNALFKQERYDDAAQAYQRTLEAVPGDADAKRNLELALRALEAKKKQQQGSKQQREQQNQQQKQNEGQQPSPSGGSDKKQERQPPNPKPDDRQGGQEGDKNHRQSQGAGKMSPEDAKKLLDSLDDQEKANLRHLAERKAKQEQESGPEEDW